MPLAVSPIKSNKNIYNMPSLILKSSMYSTFIPGIWTHSTAVPVAFERNSVKVSSAMDKSLKKNCNAKKKKIEIQSSQGEGLKQPYAISILTLQD